ncbi:hypothetical protein [Streptomyces nigrescens]|uniref:hypothetical protein n=1 Tax=Streptomyces nigrescens TaxID=1920 RepID=UPI0036FC10EA
MDETGEVAQTPAAHWPQAVFDASGAVAVAGVSASPGLPGSRSVRVAHHCPSPSPLNGQTFADVAENASSHRLRRTAPQPRLHGDRPAPPTGPAC